MSERSCCALGQKKSWKQQKKQNWIDIVLVLGLLSIIPELLKVLVMFANLVPVKKKSCPIFVKV